MPKLPAVSKFSITKTENPSDSVASWIGPVGAKNYKVSMHMNDAGKTCFIDGVMVEKPSFIFKDVITKPIEPGIYVMKITASDGMSDGYSMEFSLSFKTPEPVKKVEELVENSEKFRKLISLFRCNIESIEIVRKENAPLAEKFAEEHGQIEKIINDKIQAGNLTMSDVDQQSIRALKLNDRIGDTIIAMSSNVHNPPVKPAPPIEVKTENKDASGSIPVNRKVIWKFLFIQLVGIILMAIIYLYVMWIDWSYKQPIKKGEMSKSSPATTNHVSKQIGIPPTVKSNQSQVIPTNFPASTQRVVQTTPASPTTPTKTNKIVGGYEKLGQTGRVEIARGDIKVNGNILNDDKTTYKGYAFGPTNLVKVDKREKVIIYPQGWKPSKTVIAPGPIFPPNRIVRFKITGDEVLEVFLPERKWYHQWTSDPCFERLIMNGDGIRRSLFRVKSGYKVASIEMKITVP